MANCLQLDKRILLLVISALAFFSLAGFGELHAQETDEVKANAVAQTAVNAQNAGEFPLAALQWEKLITEYPNSSLIGLAQHNLGVCYVQTNEFKKAADALKKSLSSLPKNETTKLARSYLFLGFAQARLGKDIGDSATTEAEQEESRKWFTTATQTLEQLQTRFPNFEELDQACFFQGESYESLGRLDKAAESYTRMMKLPNQAFKFDGILALGNVYEQLDQLEKANEYYDLFRTEANAAGGHELLTEVKFRKAETILKLAAAAEKKGADGKPYYVEAERLFSEVAQQPDFDLADQALFQQAFCANRQRQFEKSADLYSKAAAQKDWNQAPRALVYAGRDYMSAGLNDKAVDALVKALQVDSEYAAEGAHWLAQLYLRDRQNEEAFKLANEWADKTTAENPIHVNLLLDRADAAFILSNRRQESPALYLEIADEHPEHSLAPTALYNAAFAFLEIGRFEEAIKMSDRFQEQYKTSNYLPDALEVKADASLLAGSPETAESVFRRLVQEYPDNSKASTWNLRIGLAQHTQEKYQETIDWLETNASHITGKSQLAEALHLIGSSHFNLNHDDEAITALQQAINTDPKWRRADETLMTLSRAQQRAGLDQEAQATTQRLLQEFPESRMVAQAIYRAGEMAYAKRDFDGALTNYQAVVQNHPKSEFAPYALYGAGWSALETKKYDQSIEFFDQLIRDYADHAQAKSAKIGRGVSRRKGGDSERAIADFTDFLNSGATGKPELDALYEMGLAQVDLKRWDDVVSTFVQLLDKAPNSNLADKYHYELAWAHQSNNNRQQALRHFGMIAREFPDSQLAPEANFHVANQAYEQKQYADAAKSYSLCLNSKANDGLREKSAYKLAWCYYKQKDYDQSLTQFRQQIDLFPEGDLKADGLLMVSDSLYRLEKHAEAFEAYRIAKPAIEATKPVNARVRWQALLHGSQSANKAKRYTEAIDFVKPIVESEVTSEALKHDAYLEIGNAHKGNRNFEEAQAAWTKAAASIGETGAEARCLIGELLFEQKKFNDAIIEYKLVIYGYGGKDATREIRPWQAFAAFEAAQCYYVQIKDAEQQLRPKLIADALKLYQYLVDNYPQDRLVNEAKNRIETLRQLN